MTSEPQIKCVGVSKIFVQKGSQHVHVLENINLEVRESEFVVLLGPGQSGKSTLLRIIAGLETPTKGEVMLRNKLVTQPGPDRSMVFQTYSLFPWRTVRENIEIGLRFKGIASAKRREIAQKYIDLVGLNGFESRYPHQLSGGMKQRVGIARAYVNDPDVLLLDEPFGQLDAQTRYLMEHEIVRIWEQEKRTVIFVTNNIDEALLLGDRIIIMEGKLPGTIMQVMNNPLPRPRRNDALEFLALRKKIIGATALTL